MFIWLAGWLVGWLVCLLVGGGRKQVFRQNFHIQLNHQSTKINTPALLQCTWQQQQQKKQKQQQQ